MNIAQDIAKYALKLVAEQRLLTACKGSKLTVDIFNGHLDPELQKIILEGASERIEKRITLTKQVITSLTEQLNNSSS